MEEPSTPSSSTTEPFVNWLADSDGRRISPNGAAASSPGLRGTSYPGNTHQTTTTPTGLCPLFATAASAATPLGLWIFHAHSQGSPLGADNPGLEAAAPLGLTKSWHRGQRTCCAGKPRPGVTDSFAGFQPERCSRTAAVSAAHAVQTGWPCVFSAIQTVHRKMNQKRGGRIALADCPRREPPGRRRSANCIVPVQAGVGQRILAN